MNNEGKIIELLGTLIDKMDKFEQGQNETNECLTSLKTEVSELKKSIITMEQNNGKIFSGLFAGYEDLYEVSGEIRSKLTSMETTQKKHDIQMLRTELERKSS